MRCALKISARGGLKSFADFAPRSPIFGKASALVEAKNGKEASMQTSIEGPNNYRVEVSGWDARELFFVEKTLFRWTDSGEKTVGLMSRLREGCVVFVRLIHAFAENANFPVAYRVQSIAPGEGDGRGCVRLVQLHPRYESNHEGPVLGKAAVDVEALKRMN
jgi:hypothetical protein